MPDETRPQASVLICNSVAQEIATNNLILIGVFDTLSAPVFPTRSTFYVVAKVWGLGAGEQTVHLRVVETASGQVVAEATGHQLRTPGPDWVHTAISLFNGVTIPRSGMYEARAYLGDQVLGILPLTVGSVN